MSSKDGWGRHSQKGGKTKSGKKKGLIGKPGWASKKPNPKDQPENLPSDVPQYYEVHDIKIADIRVESKRRALNDATVKELMESISTLGLREPITVRLVQRQSEWGKLKIHYILVDGLHRLEAMKRLGRATIPCFVMPDDKRAARLMEISASLHRRDLTPLERAKFAAEWLKLVKELAKAGHSAHPGGDQPHDKGVSKTAKQLGVSPKTVRRLRVIDRMSPEVKAAAKAAGLDKKGKQDALLEIAKERTPKAQLAKIKETVAREKGKKTGKKGAAALSSQDQKDLDELIKSWNKSELKYSFIDASDKVREKFITHIRKDRADDDE